ncbi:SMI1/KNR4 family protein [Zoogloeaceae bacterium G21618-S1]|nr:SMI1/KNR4 family protein [Zoogloeaceae bacterium G21618-S1]
MEYVDKPNGATSDEIENLESSIKVTLPNDYKKLLLESDGPILYFGHKELQFFSVGEILGEDIYQLKKYMPNCFPICLDGNSNICVAKIENRKIIGFYVAPTSNIGWDDAKYITESFQEFITDALSPEKKVYA